MRIWRAQLTVPMGRAADRPDWILQPWEILEVVDCLAELQREEADATAKAGLPPEAMMDILASNNIGYYGPHEEILRSRPGGKSAHWSGCSAGRFTMGIESDGTVKACPSLPTSPYTGGNLLEIPLEEIWEIAPEVRFVRDRNTEELWGYCKTVTTRKSAEAAAASPRTAPWAREATTPSATTAQRNPESRQARAAPKARPMDFLRFWRFEILEESGRTALLLGHVSASSSVFSMCLVSGTPYSGWSPESPGIT